MKDWYGITKQQILEFAGIRLLKRYQGSIAELLKGIYLSYKWDIYNFNSISDVHSKENRIDLIFYLAKKLEIHEVQEWYRISLLQISQVFKHTSIFKRYDLLKMLQEAYPEHQWDPYRLQYTGKRSSQRWLKVMVQQLFPNSGIA
jgi:hypothetical protein